MKILQVIILTLLLSGCRPTPSPKDYEIVKKYNEEFLNDRLNRIPVDYYTGTNIVLGDSLDQIFYHNTRNMCGTGWSVEDPPISINFNTRPLLQFNNVNELCQYIELNTLSPRLVTIASTKDTITTSNYYEFLDSLKTMTKSYLVAVRKVTPDEDLAVSESQAIRIDFNYKCETLQLHILESQIDNGLFNEESLNMFQELSKHKCYYSPEFLIQYQDLLMQILQLKSPYFLKLLQDSNGIQKENIKYGIMNANLSPENRKQILSNLEKNFEKKNSWILTIFSNRFDVQFDTK